MELFSLLQEGKSCNAGQHYVWCQYAAQLVTSTRTPFSLCLLAVAVARKLAKPEDELVCVPFDQVVLGPYGGLGSGGYSAGSRVKVAAFTTIALDFHWRGFTFTARKRFAYLKVCGYTTRYVVVRRP